MPLSYPDLIHAIGLKLPQGRPEHFNIKGELMQGIFVSRCFIGIFWPPVMLLNVFNELLLDVWFSWDGD